jgi:uncharacterized protein
VEVAELWRYPVKSLRGEARAEVELTELGIDGDRLVHAVRPGGRVFTARTHKHLLGLQGGLAEDGAPTIDGLPWGDPAALQLVREVTEPDAELVFYEGAGPQRFDVLPISVATDGGVAAVGVDRRRFRANVYLDGVEGVAERGFVGRALSLLRSDTLEQDISVLQKICFELDGVTALDCYVLEPGRVRVGDRAELLDWWTLPRPAAASGRASR